MHMSKFLFPGYIACLGSFLQEVPYDLSRLNTSGKDVLACAIHNCYKLNFFS